MTQISPIVPAVIPTSPEALATLLVQLVKVPELHVDVVDGVFVSSISWPYEPAGEPAELASLLARFSLEVDLMVSDPLKAARAWLAAGADLLVFHVETISLEDFKAFADETLVSVGICALLDTKEEVLAPYLAVADYVQVMGIATIGSQGQPFDERVFERIAWLRTVAPHLPISIDGAVNADTLPKIIPHQLHRYIVGSAIVGQANPQQAYDELVKLVSSTGVIPS
jgi:ribulose-phosphate 3-epimerase